MATDIQPLLESQLIVHWLRLQTLSVPQGFSEISLRRCVYITLSDWMETMFNPRVSSAAHIVVKGGKLNVRVSQDRPWPLQLFLDPSAALVSPPYCMMNSAWSYAWVHAGLLQPGGSKRC